MNVSFYYILDPFTKSQHVFMRTSSRMNSEVPVVEKGKKIQIRSNDKDKTTFNRIS